MANDEYTVTITGTMALAVMVSGAVIYRTANAVGDLWWGRSRLESTYPGIDWSRVSAFSASDIWAALNQPDRDACIDIFVNGTLLPGIQCLIDSHGVAAERVYATAVNGGNVAVLKFVDNRYTDRFTRSFKVDMAKYAILCGRLGSVRHLLTFETAEPDQDHTPLCLDDASKRGMATFAGLQGRLDIFNYLLPVKSVSSGEE